MSAARYMTTGGVFSLSCCILILLCVVFLILMDGVRLYSNWPTRGLFLLALFGADALACSLIDAGLLAGGLNGAEAVSQIVFLWAPFLLMLYYFRVVRKNFRKRMLLILVFDAALSAFLLVLFFALPKERVVTEVFTLFMLGLSAAAVIVTLIQWHGGQRGYRRIYWENSALLILLAACITRLVIKESYQTASTALPWLRIGGVAMFMLTMTAMQFYAILMEYRTVVDRTAKELEERNAELLKARDEAESARVAAEEASEVKTRLLTKVYHEIRTPVNAVLGMDEMILRESRDKNIRSYARDIYAAGQRIQSLVDDTPMDDLEKKLVELTEEDHLRRGWAAPGAKLLVVDDNEMNRRVFKQLIKRTEASVTEADSGSACLEAASRERFDIIFLDHMMPGMDGIETLRRLKELSEAEDFPCASSPVYCLTANAVAGAEEEYISEGFDGFLSKPVVTEKLLDIMKRELAPELITEGDIPEEEDKEGGAMPSDLPAVEGLDWSYAWLHLPDMDMLADSVKTFYELIDSHAEKLEAAFSGISGAEGADAYRIQVHGMKSSAATIGIVPLAGLANILEIAARDMRLDEILSAHRVFMESWRSYKDKLKGVFGCGADEDGGDKETADPELIKALLGMVKTAMEELDVDAADEAVSELNNYDCGEKNNEMKRLKTAVADLDGDLAIEIADSILSFFEGGNTL